MPQSYLLSCGVLLSQLVHAQRQQFEDLLRNYLKQWTLSFQAFKFLSPIQPNLDLQQLIYSNINFHQTSYQLDICQFRRP